MDVLVRIEQCLQPEAEEAKKKQGANNYLLIIGVYCVHRSAGLRDLRLKRISFLQLIIIIIL